MGSLSSADSPLGYPNPRRDDSVVDNYHGVSIPDPYRWLEDPDSEESEEWVRRQAELTEWVLKACDAREGIRERMKEALDHPRYTPPFKRGLRLFYFHNAGLQPQHVLYAQEGLEGNPEVLLDPNELSQDGTISLSICSVSEDGRYLAYGLSASGSDWITVKVMRIATASPSVQPDTISWVKFSSIAWTHDTKGFFYSRYSAANQGQASDGTDTNVILDHQLYYHFLGTDQSDDILCWRDPLNPKYIYSAAVTEDGKYVILYIEEGCEVNKKVYYLDLSSLTNGLRDSRYTSQTLPFTKFIDRFEASYNVVSNDESIFTFLTNKDAPKYKLVRVDLNSPDLWHDVVPEHDKDVLVSAHAVNRDKLLLRYLRDVKYVLQVRDLETGTLIHRLPIDIGTIYGISTRRKESAVFVGFSSFLTPGIIYHCDLRTPIPEMNIFREISVPNFDRSQFQVEQAFVASEDGTKIPIFIVARKGVRLDGSHPCLLYGYGGFGVSMTPSFSVSRVVLLKELGMVYAIANIRGGGEYGEEWHKAGSLANKHKCFDDFISAAEYLIAAGYTRPSKLCIEGGSNGGLLVGACINQRPELFGCALAHVGVMDMLRFHRFTIGHAWTCDFGCSDKEEEFKWLIKYSPLHNVRRPWEAKASPRSGLQYPATMLLTADHDDRVVPLHSLKLLATMQHVLCTSVERSPQTNPIVGRIERKAGHGAGRPTQKLIDEAADRYGFMAKMLDAVWNK